MDKKKYRRKNRKNTTVNALNDAQKIVFAPLTFQAVSTLLDLGILDYISKDAKTINQITGELKLDKYTVKTLFDVATCVDIVEKTEENSYKLGNVGKCFVFDEMTKTNFNFIKKCCYLGASELTNSFKYHLPMGLKKFFVDSDTIYPHLPTLKNDFKESWYNFDNFYSDNCFESIYEIIMSKYPEKIFDIGGNSGKFEEICLKNNPMIDITMIDLKENIEVVSKKECLRDCKFHSVNILDDNIKLPDFSGAVLMSQFLDCFSPEQIISILSRICKSSKKGTNIYILEPFTDNQVFDGAKLALVHTSLYFTCMANGYSKFYELADMKNFINQSGLLLAKVHENIGNYNYTLLECVVL